MKPNYIAHPSRTKEILSKYKFSTKKSLGQNFLIDVNVLTNIIDAAGIDKSMNVIEIGPGIGSLTEQIALRAKKVVAYEIDDRLRPVLADTLGDYENIKLIYEDILEADIKAMIEDEFDGGSVHVIANLPYYVTTPILLKLLHDDLPIETMTVMMQKEVAERMAAKPNTKAYGSLTIAVQYYSKARIVLDVPGTVFIPPPRITLSVLHLDLTQDKPVDVENESLFFELVRASFVHRRKTILNNLNVHFKDVYEKETVKSLLNEAGIEASRRGESLDLAEFAKLSEVFDQHK